MKPYIIFLEGREKDKKVADAHFSPHFWLQRGDRHSRRGKFPTYFPTEIFPVRTQKDSQRRPFGIQAMFSWRLKKRAVLVVVKISVMSEPHHFNGAGTFCLVQNCSLLTADMFFGHLKSWKKTPKNKLQEQTFFFFLLPSSTKEMQQNVHRRENTTGVDVLLSNKAYVMWVRGQTSKSMSLVLVSIYKFNRKSCSNKHGHLGQHLKKISRVQSFLCILTAFNTSEETLDESQNSFPTNRKSEFLLLQWFWKRWNVARKTCMKKVFCLGMWMASFTVYHCLPGTRHLSHERGGIRAPVFVLQPWNW